MLIDLMGQAVELKEEVGELKETVRKRDAEILDLKGKDEFRSKIVFHKMSYFERSEVDGKRVGEPVWCAHCWDVDQLQVHLHKVATETYICPRCRNSVYGDKGPVTMW